MKTFILQIFASLLLGYAISASLSKLFIQDYKNALEEAFNFHRVELVLNGFESRLPLEEQKDAIWLFQCDVATGELQRVDEDEYSLTRKYQDRHIRATFNSSAYQNDPIIKKLMWVELAEDLIQILCTLLVLVVSLRTWTNGIQSLQYLSSRYAKGDFKARTDVVGPEAIKTLINNQHQMAQAIDSLMTRQKMIFAALPHDIRTPLSAIQLTSDMMEEGGVDNTFLVNRLGAQVNSLNTLCESSLHLLKILNKEVPLQREFISFQAILDLALEAQGCERQIKRVNTQQLVFTDKRVLKVLLLNILSNASRYSHSEIEVVFMAYPNVDVVKISDDGDGFEPATIEAFNSGKVNDVSPKDGFGIGMLLIYELANYLNGRVLLSNTAVGGQVILIMNR
ncbi:sensor histidine kinase [Vibrio harveyi]|uniref:sensor histidine kinase n=1 Tax=Vibrio harveyi TaxID=669 RepID=UPI002481515D|nr:HAMP domain-containing sensor histidine kinase [Vibrio harveyi]